METNKVIVVIGGRNSGKTTFLKKLAQKSPLKKLIVDDFDSPVWRDWSTFDNPNGSIIPIITASEIERFKKGSARVFRPSIEEILESIAIDLMNTLVIFEDASKYIRGTLGDSMRKIVYDSKQKNNTIILVFHSLMRVPPEFVETANYLTIFRTNDQEVPRKFQIPEVKALWEHVQDHAQKRSEPYYNRTIELN